MQEVPALSVMEEMQEIGPPKEVQEKLAAAGVQENSQQASAASKPTEEEALNRHGALKNASDFETTKADPIIETATKLSSALNLAQDVTTP